MIVIITQWHVSLATTLLPFPLYTIHLSAGPGSLHCPRAPIQSARRRTQAWPPIPTIITEGPVPHGVARFPHRSDSWLALVITAPKHRKSSTHWPNPAINPGPRTQVVPPNAPWLHHQFVFGECAAASGAGYCPR